MRKSITNSRKSDVELILNSLRKQLEMLTFCLKLYIFVFALERELKMNRIEKRPSASRFRRFPLFFPVALKSRKSVRFAHKPQP